MKKITVKTMRYESIDPSRMIQVELTRDTEDSFKHTDVVLLDGEQRIPLGAIESSEIAAERKISGSRLVSRGTSKPRWYPTNQAWN